ncbi:glycosyltransferase [Phycisphaerales bacterium AB-hyl4]|uniref:starch synthase n=1 Tax=Natronomicrosphaera hydrolytica TaxID=3242702 RepID=A0ABV4U285_9BACT
MAMRVLMLGWEFPPHITGGLGTACYGLTKAMHRLPVEITFVLPRPVQADPASIVRVVPTRSDATPQSPIAYDTLEPGVTPPATPAIAPSGPPFEHVRFHHLPIGLTATGGLPGAYGHRGPALTSTTTATTTTTRHTTPAAPTPPDAPRQTHDVGLGDHTSTNRAAAHPDDHGHLAACHRYAHMCVQLARHEKFDVIHAHDWMTFPAAMTVAAESGKPMVAHVHSTEFDRAGEQIDYRIFDIERRGVHAAVRVVAVSHLTRSILMSRYDVEPKQIDVVYNGIDHPDIRWPDDTQAAAIRPSDRIVLFLGRITMQKGPEYFVAAAKKVLEHDENVKFLVAGAGDRVPEVIRLAAREGLAHKILFTGFLDQADVARVFRMANVYVMPSVSEPFGIAALEAIRHDVPVIVSRSSGVSEVIQHALKVDFWDVNDIADKILAVLRHPPLASELRQNAEIEVRKLTWTDAARHVYRVYEDAIAAMPV